MLTAMGDLVTDSSINIIKAYIYRFYGLDEYGYGQMYT